MFGRIERLALLGGVLFVLGAGGSMVLRLVYDTRPAYVNIRWAPSLDSGSRVLLEKRYGLARPELRENRTWGYYLTNLSRENIQALVHDPAVEDTHQIHREEYRVWRRAGRTPDAPVLPDIPPVYAALARVLLIGGELAIGLSVVRGRVIGRSFRPSL